MPNRIRALRLRLGFPAAALLVWALASAQSADPPAWKWYKGNLHTHTVNSDGDSAPDAVARWYKEHRYNFLALTDHNYLTDPAGLNSIFAAKERFLLLRGEEVTSRYESKPIHVNAWGLSKTIEPRSGRDVVETIRKNVDAILEGGAVASLNHPNFGWAVTPAELAQVRNLNFFEVYNGHPRTNEFGGGGLPDLDELWDAVLTTGKRIYGVAVDDAHHFKKFGPEFSNPGRGWIRVKARRLSPEAIYSALKAGEFYSSNGVELSNVVRLGDGLRIEFEEGRNVKYTVSFLGQGGKLLAESYHSPAEYRLKPGEKYVRAKIVDSTGHAAWVQPVFAE